MNLRLLVINTTKLAYSSMYQTKRFYNKLSSLSHLNSLFAYLSIFILEIV